MTFSLSQADSIQVSHAARPFRDVPVWIKLAVDLGIKLG